MRWGGRVLYSVWKERKKEKEGAQLGMAYWYV